MTVTASLCVEFAEKFRGVADNFCIYSGVQYMPHFITTQPVNHRDRLLQYFVKEFVKISGHSDHF